MISTKSKLLLASTALIAAGVTNAQAADSSLAVSGAINAGTAQLLLDSGTDAAVASGDVISVAGSSIAAELADTDNTTGPTIDVDVAGVTLNVDADVAGDAAAVAAIDVTVHDADTVININDGVTVTNDTGAPVIDFGGAAAAAGTLNVIGDVSGSAVGANAIILGGATTGNARLNIAGDVAGIIDLSAAGVGTETITLTSDATITGDIVEGTDTTLTVGDATINSTAFTASTVTVTGDVDVNNATVAQGTFAVGSNLDAGNDITIASGATADVTGTTTTGNDLIINGTADFTGAVTAGNDLTVAGTVTSAGGTAVTAGDATISGTFTESGTFDVNGANSLLTVSGTLTAAGAASASSATIATGGTATFNGVFAATGNMIVNGTATFGDATADDSTVAGTLTVGSNADVTLNADITTITALSIADGASVKVKTDGVTTTTLNADTGASDLNNVTLMLADTDNISGILSFDTDEVDMTSEQVKLSVAQGVTLTDGRVYDKIVVGASAAVSTTAAPIVTGNALYKYTWTTDVAGYDLLVELQNAGVTTLAGAATGANNKGVAAVVDSAALASLYSDVMAQSDTDSALESLTPDVSGGAQAAAINTSVASTGTISNRLSSLRGVDNGRTGAVAGDHEMHANRGMWIQAFGSMADQDDRDGVAGFEATTTGMAIGVDSDDIMENTRLGAAFAYAVADVESDAANNGQTDIDTYQLSFYGSHNYGNGVFVDGMLSYAWNEHEATRTDFLGDTYEGDFDGTQWSVKAETGKSYDWKNAKVTPTVGVHYINIETDSYDETGAGANGLSVSSDDVTALLLSVGSDIEWEMMSKDGSTYKPYLRAKYSYDVEADNAVSTVGFQAGGSNFQVEGADVAEHTVTLGTGVNVMTANGFEITAGYDMDLKEDFMAHSGMLNARWAF